MILGLFHDKIRKMQEIKSVRSGVGNGQSKKIVPLILRSNERVGAKLGSLRLEFRVGEFVADLDGETGLPGYCKKR